MTAGTRIAHQIAALPIQWNKKGKLRVLMVTSRDTGRWVMPKGWLMDGETPWTAAEIEALEEAGAIGSIATEAIGFYHYDKRLKQSASIPCRVTVYPMVVEKLKRRWKERNQRKRRWFAPREAARLVDERELAAVFRGLAKQPHEQPIIRALRKAS